MERTGSMSSDPLDLSPPLYIQGGILYGLPPWTPVIQNILSLAVLPTYLTTMPGKHKIRKSYADPDRPQGQRLTERERAQIMTLYNIAKWNISQIAKELRLAHITVQRCIRLGVWTPKRPIGRKPMLTTKKRRCLTHHATLNANHRRLSYGSTCIVG